MAVSYGDMPMGITQIKIKIGTTVKELPAANTLKFKEKVLSARGRGGSRLRALASVPDGVEWEMNSLGVSLDIYAMMTGLTPVVTGVTPSQVKTLSSSDTNRYPYFEIYGKSLGVGADDIHVHIINAKLTDGMEAPIEDGKFTESAFKGEALDWEIVQNETAGTLPADA